MDSIKILHTADIHLSGCRDDVYETFTNIIGLAEKEGTEYLFISGDLFDTRIPDNTLVSKVKDILSCIKACKIFISPGNHDPFTHDSPYQTGTWPLNVHIFKDKLSYYTYGNVRIYGRAFTGHFQETSLLTRITPDAGYINILVMHGDIDGYASQYNPIPLSLLKESKFDYVALGHIHKSTVLPHNGLAHYIYPGIPEGRGFDETGDTGIITGTVSKGTFTIKHRPVSKKRYIIHQMDITDLTNTYVIADKIKRELIRNEDYYRIILNGNVDTAPDIAGITALTKPYYRYVEISDNTRLNIDIEVLKKENSLKGIFVRKMCDMIRQKPEDKTLEESLILGLKAFEDDIEVRVK